MVHNRFRDRFHNKQTSPMVRPLNESQGPSPLQGHGFWLVCEVALTSVQNLVHGSQLVQENVVMVVC